MIVALTSLAGCSSNTETASRKALEATALFEAGNLRAARLAAMDSVEARDDISENWILLGRIELTSQHFSDAYTAYSRALELDPVNAEAMQIIAEIALQAGRFRDAERWSDQLLALQPGLARPNLIKGLIALNQNRLIEANRLADEAIRLDPSDDAAVSLKARVLARNERPAEARKLLEDHLKKGGEGEAVMATLAELYRNDGDGAALAGMLERLIAKSPLNDRVFDLATVQYKRGQKEVARSTVFNRLRSQGGDEALHDAAARFFLEQDPGVFDSPGALAQDASPAMRVMAARVLLGRGRPDQAFAAVEPVTRQGVSSEVWAIVADARDRQGRFADAKGLINDILKRDEDNASALIVRSRQSLRAGNLRAALEDAQIAVREDPASLDARLAVIAVYERRSDLLRVRQLFEDAVRDMPSSLRMTRAYVAFLVNHNDLLRARQISKKYSDLNPARVAGWELLNSMCADAQCKGQAMAGRRAALASFERDGNTVSLSRAELFGAI